MLCQVYGIKETRRRDKQSFGSGEEVIDILHLLKGNLWGGIDLEDTKKVRFKLHDQVTLGVVS